MTNSKALLFFFIPATLAYAQPGLLGSGGSYSKEGWKFSYSLVAKPPLKPGQHISFQGIDVLHTYAKDGNPGGVFHRFLTDPVSKTYWGYDVVIEPLAQPGLAQLRFQPLSLPDILPKRDRLAGFRSLGSSQFPLGTFQSGQIIAVDILTDPSTGQRVVDYIQVSFEPTRSVASEAAPRDFQVSDVLLNIRYPTLLVNDVQIPAAIVADQFIRRKLAWLSVPGRGRFLFTLSSQTGYPFQLAGMVKGNTLSFSWNGNRYEWRSHILITESSGVWNLYVLAAPPLAAAAGVSYGAVNSVEEFLSMTQ